MGAGDTFILVTLLVLYGRSPADRGGELRAIAAWLADWASSAHAFHHNLIALGDFNIDRRGDPRYEAFTSTGLTLPAPRGSPHHLRLSPRQQDQIAWFTAEDSAIPTLSLEPTDAAASLDLTGLVPRHLTRQEPSRRPRAEPRSPPSERRRRTGRPCRLGELELLVSQRRRLS
jgi:hypothetical protein